MKVKPWQEDVSQVVLGPYKSASKYYLIVKSLLKDTCILVFKLMPYVSVSCELYYKAGEPLPTITYYIILLRGLITFQTTGSINSELFRGGLVDVQCSCLSLKWFRVLESK